MKKLYIIFLIIIFLILTGCTKAVEAKTVETQIVTVTSIVEDTTKISELEKQLKDSKKELLKYQGLIGNLNSLLKNVYYVYQKKSDGSSVWGTGFSMGYKDKYYLITVGHAIENKHGVFKNLGFKANFSDNWIYPKLLTYENNFGNNRDYAIFYSDKIKSGLDFDIKNTSPEYILGNENNNIFKGFNLSNLKEGESGSPIIDLDGQVTEIVTGNFTDIDLVLGAIDNLK